MAADEDANKMRELFIFIKIPCLHDAVRQGAIGGFLSGKIKTILISLFTVGH